MQIIEQQPTFLGEPWTPGLPTTFLSGVFCTPGGMAWPWLGGRPWARYCCCRARNCCSSSATTCTIHPPSSVWSSASKSSIRSNSEGS